MLRRLNKALPGLALGIFLYGIAAQLIGVWLVKDKLQYSTGLWIGVLLAAGMAVHMAVVLEDAVSTGSSQGKLVTMSLLRYAAVVLVFFCIMKFHLGNPIAAFVGVMSLKIAAYLQPSIHKIISKKKGSEEFFEDKIQEMEKNEN